MAAPVETVDQMVARLQSGDRWVSPTVLTIGYSLTGLTRLDAGGNIQATGADLSDAQAITPMTPAERNYAREAFELWDDLISAQITENGDRNANITFNYTTSATHASNGYAQTATNADREFVRAGIWFTNNAEYTNDANFGSNSFGTHAQNNYIHEIGHALGLRHPGAYDSVAGGTITYADDAEFAQDTEQYSIMSYFTANNYGGVDHTDASGTYIYPQTPMLIDVLAVQRTYGADPGTRFTDTVYGFGSTAGRSVFDFSRNDTPVLTIWDADGIDTLNLSGFNGDQVVNLEPGTFSSVGNRWGSQLTELTQNVAIAFGATIENATGGSGHDTIWGNSAGNFLMGNAGNDSLRGWNGGDTLMGGVGSDTLDGGTGYDCASYAFSPDGVTVLLLADGSSSGKVIGGGDATGDTLISIEDLTGSFYNDSLHGNDDYNRIEGAWGNRPDLRRRRPG